MANRWLVAVALGLAATNAQASVAAPAKAGSTKPSAGAAQNGEISESKANAILSKCGLRKFETEAQFDNDGKTRKAKIVLCAKPGDTDAQWIATLGKAALQVQASTELSEEARTKISGELRAEIARLRGDSQGR